MIKKVFNKENILDIVQDFPGVSSSEIAKKLGMSRVSAYLYLQSLISEGLIRIDGNGKATRYFPQEVGYINHTLKESGISLTPSQVHILKIEILNSLYEKYEEDITEEDIDTTFEKYCMYITSDGVIRTGFIAFILWCMDTKHKFSDRIVAKSVEYLDLIGSIEYLRKKNGFFDGSEAARTNLLGTMEVSFDAFLFCMPSVLRNGFGRTRTSLELNYGKKNSNPYLLKEAITDWIDPIQHYIEKEEVNACIFTPPTEGRRVQFRDVLEKELKLKIPKIVSEKISLFGKVLEPQKDIHDKEKRVRNAIQSLEVTIPPELNFYTHILILDDSFTTGATPNAIALKLREAGYTGKISIITICGSFDYDLAITEDEI